MDYTVLHVFARIWALNSTFIQVLTLGSRCATDDFFFRKHIAREGLALYCTMVRTIGANRDVLLKIVTNFKLPAGGVPNDVKVKTLLRQSLRSS